MVLIEFLHKDFSYVLLCVFYAIIMDAYLTMKVVNARKKYGVDYPAMYSDKVHIFNCIQRAHQNALELLPVFLFTLILVGIAYPKYAAACGSTFITSRFSYAWGYYTGDPKKRVKGGYGLIGQLGLILGLLYVAAGQCGCLDAYLPF